MNAPSISLAARFVAVVLVSIVSSFSFIAVAAPGDEHWDAQFGAPGVSNVTFAVAVNNELIYAAGLGTGVHTNTPLNVWNGKQWTVAAIFKGPASQQINDLRFVGDTLYVAGNFTNVNGVLANGLAKWDGTSWSGIGFSGVAYALAVDGNNLYVGGSFTNVGSVTATNIGYWDGSQWHALGDGIGSIGPYAVRAVAAKNGMVYAGGYFANSGSQSITNLAVWNGATWSAVGGGVNSLVATLAIDNNHLYAGGYFTLAGTTPVNGLAEWDGTNWSDMNGGIKGSSPTASSIASFNGVICVSGTFTNAGGVTVTNFATWNGSSWSGAAGSLSGPAEHMVANGGKLYVVGLFTVAGGVWVNEIASWDGTQWAALGTPSRMNGVQSSVTALANDGTNLYAAGSFIYAGQTNANRIAKWDGKNWHPLGTGLNDQVIALAVTNDIVYAGGRFTGTTDGQPLHYIGYWDGTNWNSLGDAGGLVYALAVSSNGLYAAGTYYTGTTYGSPYFSRWDGTNWQNAINFVSGTTLFAVPLTDSVGYDAIAIQGRNVYLGGNIPGFTQFDPNVGPDPSTNCQSIIRFDPNYGWIMGTGLNGVPVALAALGTNLIAAGTFTLAGGVPANQIAKWDGKVWSSVGGSVIGNGTVNALTVMGSDLYAGGTFTNMGGVSVSRIARWDGTNWSALGSGVYSYVFSLTAFGSNLFAGGNIRAAGDKPAYNLAHWNSAVDFDIPQLINPVWLSNHQFQARIFGISGITNIIEASTNLMSWSPILTNSDGIYDFTDPSASGYPKRFYRAVLAP